MTKDNINPNHYKIGNFETIDLIQDVVKDFGSVCQANILKYGIRANKKHDEPQDDIKKIIRYCEFWLNDLEGLKASEKRSEEIAVFDKLNDLLNVQEKEFLKDRNINCVVLNGANLPLEELSVDNGVITYKGQPWDNMSGSEQLIVATAIVRKINSQCEFVLVDKLEQMDLETLVDFGNWLKDNNLQAIATRVSTGEECQIIIEDGYVKNKTTEVPSWTNNVGGSF